MLREGAPALRATFARSGAPQTSPPAGQGPAKGKNEIRDIRSVGVPLIKYNVLPGVFVEISFIL